MAPVITAVVTVITASKSQIHVIAQVRHPPAPSRWAVSPHLRAAGTRAGSAAARTCSIPAAPRIAPLRCVVTGAHDAPDHAGSTVPSASPLPPTAAVPLYLRAPPTRGSVSSTLKLNARARRQRYTLAGTPRGCPSGGRLATGHYPLQSPHPLSRPSRLPPQTDASTSAEHAPPPRRRGAVASIYDHRALTSAHRPSLRLSTDDSLVVSILAPLALTSRLCEQRLSLSSRLVAYV